MAAIENIVKFGGGLRRAFEDPGITVQSATPFRARDAYHAVLRSYYANTIYEDALIWQTYKSRYRLPRAIRSIYNPTRRAVDFYSGAVYPGSWTEDGKPSPSGRPHAIRYPSDLLETKPELIAAALQALTWGNWNAERMTYVREGAKTGSVLLEIVDDVENGKVRPEIIPLDRVWNINLDPSGNVKSYALDYMAIDQETKRPYHYHEDVTATTITEYRDNSITDERENPYGFAPAVWVRHRHVGNMFGAPAIDGVIPKIDEANRLATSMHNYVVQLQKQPTVFWSKTSPAPLAKTIKKGGATGDLEAAVLDETVSWLWSNDTDGRNAPLMNPVPIDGAGTRLDKLLEEIESDLPEISLNKEMRTMQLVSGPGAERINSDVASKLYEAEANYDAGLIKAQQMSVAIGGWRLNTGAWGTTVSRQQEKFRPFDLESYAKGDLDMALLERPLFEETDLERMTVMNLKKTVAGLPDSQVQRELGYSDDDIAEFAGQAADAAKQALVGQF